jgi:putative ABC transport system permease protein
MLTTLALAALTRHRARTTLATLGVAISSAMLLDMVMLSTGMRESFRSLLLAQGYQLRLSPKGTLPFDTEATIANGDSLGREIARMPGVLAVSPVLGGQLHVATTRGVVATAVLGVNPILSGDFELASGSLPTDDTDIVTNDFTLAALGKHVGDTLLASTGYDPQLRAFTGQRVLRITGRVRFIYMAADQKALAMRIEALRSMMGTTAQSPVSLVMVRIDSTRDIEAERALFQRTFPRTTVISTEAALRQVDERMSYFRQLAVILGGVSLVVGFLLVTTLVTVSVNERIGEIAVMRAIGVKRWRIVAQIMLESSALMAFAIPPGVGLGLVTSRYLNSILATFPGVPERIDFFLFQPSSAWSAMGMLMVSGIFAAIYPSLRSASLPIASTLRQEAVG